MKKIKVLAEQIRDEISDADKYAWLALEYKDSDHALADTYYNLSKQEINHAHMEHDQVARLIKLERENGTVVPQAMLDIWEWQHKNFMEDEKEVRLLWEMYTA